MSARTKIDACWGRLPAEYAILPHSIEHRIPDFERSWFPGRKTLAPEAVNCGTWYEQFVRRVEEAVGQRFLPICRMSDGEYLLLLGPQIRDTRLGWIRWVYWFKSFVIYNVLRRPFRPQTAPGVSSGVYSQFDASRLRQVYASKIRWLAENGLMALHLTWGKAPFQEYFHPALARWLNEQGVTITVSNYIPFYFVYALLRGNRRGIVFENRRVLVIHGATEEKKQRICDSLLRERARSVDWCAISSTRSLYDNIDISKWIGRVDVCLIGAGVGKINILAQLERLCVPCIDAGYAFEVWADESKKFGRDIMMPDDDPDWDSVA